MCTYDEYLTCLEKCPASAVYDFGDALCGGRYSEGSNNYKVYGRGWKNNSSGRAYGTYKVEKTWENPWTYKSEDDLKSHSFFAKLHTYPGGGYVRTLGKTMEEARSTIQYLKKHLWIDSLTRAVFLEFTTYNNNDNFFSIVTLVIECIGTGGAFPFSQIVTTRLDRYNSTFSFFLAVCEISFLLLSFYYIWLGIKKARKKGISYLRNIGGIIELLIFVLTWVTFALLLVRLSVIKWTKSAYKSNPNGFTSFQLAASSDMAYGYAIAAVVFLVFLKMLKVLRCNHNMLLVLKTMQLAGNDLLHYLVFFSLAFIAYICWGTLSFGCGHSGYTTLLQSSMSILNLLLGASRFQDMVEANRVIAPIFLGMFAFTMNVLLLNLFLTILMDAFSEIRKEVADQPNKYDILNFLLHRLVTLYPCLHIAASEKNLNNIQRLLQVELPRDYFEFHLFSVEAELNRIGKSLDTLQQSEREDFRDFSQFILDNSFTREGRDINRYSIMLWWCID